MISSPRRYLSPWPQDRKSTSNSRMAGETACPPPRSAPVGPGGFACHPEEHEIPGRFFMKLAGRRPIPTGSEKRDMVIGGFRRWQIRGGRLARAATMEMESAFEETAGFVPGRLGGGDCLGSAPAQPASARELCAGGAPDPGQRALHQRQSGAVRMAGGRAPK